MVTRYRPYLELGLMVTAGMLLYRFWDALGQPYPIDYLFEWRELLPPLTLLFRGATFLGDDAFYAGFLSILLWCVHKPLAYGGALMLLVSGVFNNILKDLFALPRPVIGSVTLPAGYAFPSGHALTTTVLWGYLAHHLGDRKTWITSGLIIILVGISRMALGYHYPRDVIGGILLGVLFLLIAFWMVRQLPVPKVGGNPLIIPFVIGTILPIGLFFLIPGRDIPMIAGFLLGAAWGYGIEKKYIDMDPRGPWTQQILKAVLGLGSTLLLFLTLRFLLPEYLLSLIFLRYAITAFWIVFLVPALFLHLKLTTSSHLPDE